MTYVILASSPMLSPLAYGPFTDRIAADLWLLTRKRALRFHYDTFFVIAVASTESLDCELIGLLD